MSECLANSDGQFLCYSISKIVTFLVTRNDYDTVEKWETCFHSRTVTNKLSVRFQVTCHIPGLKAVASVLLFCRRGHGHGRGRRATRTLKQSNSSKT